MKRIQLEKAKTAKTKGTGTAPVKLDKQQVKALIDKIKDRKGPELELLQMERESKQAKLRRKLGRQLRTEFAGAAFDARKIDKVLAGNQAELSAVLKKEAAAAAKKAAPIIKRQQAGIANTRAALEHIRYQPHLTTTIPISTPFLIYATPVGMLSDTHTEPFNNFAKFFYTSDRNTAYDSVVVKFFFAWQNNSDFLAVINCSTSLIANGLLIDTAEPGWLFPGSAWIEAWARLTVYMGTTTINYQGSQQKQMGQVYTEAGYSEFGAPGSINSVDLVGSFDLSASNIAVDPGRIVVFEVACSADWWIDFGGSITLDFNSNVAARQLLCPSLQVELLTAPQGGFNPVAGGFGNAVLG
ncbi:hypothetical protein [Dongia sp.]|uniref:hypothetical protein n=1 Tax=Dongia sp. TaxID=1977262 RepID=UPI003752B9DD